MIVRIVCRELESWYFGDLTAVENALDVPNLVKHQKKKKYRVPDDIGAPATELQKITSNAYEKVAGSQAIGSRLSLTSNTSKSFQVFIKRIRRIVQTN